MRTLAFAVVLLAFAGASTGQQPEPKGKSDPKQKPDQELIQGTWNIVGLDAGGKPEPPKNYQGNSIVFAKDKATLREWGHPPIDFTFTLEPSKSPKWIDLTTATKGTTLRGVYKLAGDDLTVCLSVGATRPTEFTTKTGGDTEMFTLRRNRWERHTDKGLGFWVEMPGKPEERARDIETPIGKLATTILVVRSEMDRVSYLVAVTALPGKSAAKVTIAADAVRAALVSEFHRNARTAATEEKDFTASTKDYAGKEMTLGLELPSSKDKAAVRARTFVAGDRLYALAVAGTEEGSRSQNTTRFWNSFRLITEKKKN